MTLRVRLVGSLAALLVAGLLAFGIGTYGSYARSQWGALDDQIRRSTPVVSRALTDPRSDGTVTAQAGDPNLVVPPGTYAELRSDDQTVVATVQLAETTSKPKLPTTLGFTSRPITVSSVDGSTSWRVLVQPDISPVPQVSGARRILVIAVPTTSVDRALRRLVVIETGAGLMLLLVLCGGSWLILRRGLRPLESMAHAARDITAGDLSKRVAPAEGSTEIGQLGLALNGMLDGIEAAFAQRDATEHKLRRFLADASHELRTPLTSIHGFAELSRLGGENGVDHRLAMSRIEDEAARMKRLVEDLLLLARLDETRPYEPVAVDLAVVCADACAASLALDPARPLELDAPAPVVVQGQPDHLRQAITNLVVNAIRHTPTGTPIIVEARWSGGGAEVVVRDSGPGLDEEALAQVFDRFWQADRSRQGTGSGLGLSIVAGIAHEHGGTVAAANRPEGGAAFTLRIPSPLAS